MDKTMMMRELGIGNSFTTYDILKVDNGDDKSGTNATGEWVHKTKDGEVFKREKYGKTLNCVVLAARAQAKSRFKQGVSGWYSDEFNPSVKSVIQVWRDKTVVFSGTYQELKSNFSVPDGSGGMTKNYTYSTILYAYLPDKDTVVKLVLTGKTQGKWIEFSSSLPRADILLSKETICEVKEEDGSYYANFKRGEAVDVDKMWKMAEGLLGDITRTPQIEQKKELPQPKTEDDIPIIQVDEEDEVKVENVPF